jgi:hypothetical protein
MIKNKEDLNRRKNVLRWGKMENRLQEILDKRGFKKDWLA